MTDQPNPAVPDETTPDLPNVEPPAVPAASPTPEAPAAPPPHAESATLDDADAGAAPAHVVSRDSGTIGAEAPAGRRSSGARWAIALGGVAIVVAITAAIIALAGGRPNTSVAVGYMPNDSIAYSEVRLDLPGDQRAKLGAFMSSFPGFDDQAAFDPKLDELLDRLVRMASEDQQSWTGDIKPWFGGVIAVGSGPMSPPSALGAATPLGGGSLVAITVTDRAKAVGWLQKTAGEALTESEYGGATLLTGPDSGFGTTFVLAVTDKVILGGTDADVRAAVDSKGEGKLADDDEFKAAYGIVKSDYVAFGFVDYRSLIQSAIAGSGAGSGLDSTTVDDELLSMVPPWFASVARIEDDAIVTDGAFPSIDFGFDAKNKRGVLAGHTPANTIVYAESHDIGTALVTLLDRFRQMPELRDSFGQLDTSAGMIGGVDGIIGWWGDVAVAISKQSDGSYGGGLLITPTDVDKASAFFGFIRSAIVLGGRGAGLEVRDVPHGDTTISVIDFSAAAGSSGALPPGVKAEVAYAVTPELVAFGYGEAWVASVLDAEGATSLAGTPRYQELLKRVGEENLGVTFIDVTAIRELLEPLMKPELSADDWAFYEREIKPYLLPFDAVISSSVKDGGIDHLVQSLVVK
ncbi:MAG TPA: DUF3352 domain-containing protein [Candidatus Limnocylindrales bacterium]|nr:DUF3352 domain-containing protein [Candidatus Limnocylindrales bacterium]